MERTQILETIKNQAGKIFALSPEAIGEEDGYKQVKGWDSLAHLRLFMAVEAEYGIKFDVGEITNTQTIGAITTLVMEKV